MQRKYRFLPWLILILLLAACSQPADAPSSPSNDMQSPPTDTPEPTTSPPTQTPGPPTETPEPTSTALPEGVLFRDDFEGSLQPGWEWENENPARWSFTGDGWLEIIGEQVSLLGNQTQNNLLWYPRPEGEVVIEVHLSTYPYRNFQQSTIYIYEDPENYIALNRGYCDICSTGGGGFYMEYKIDKAWGAYQIATDTDDVYLRLENKEDQISGFYAESPDQWERIGRFGNFFQFSRVGIGVTNSGTDEPVTGKFDYFQISLP